MQLEVVSGNVYFMLSKHFIIQSSLECSLQKIHYDETKRKCYLVNITKSAVTSRQCKHTQVILQSSCRTSADEIMPLPTCLLWLESVRRSTIWSIWSSGWDKGHKSCHRKLVDVLFWCIFQNIAKFLVRTAASVCPDHVWWKDAWYKLQIDIYRKQLKQLSVQRVCLKGAQDHWSMKKGKSQSWFCYFRSCIKRWWYI